MKATSTIKNVDASVFMHPLSLAAKAVCAQRFNEHEAAVGELGAAERELERLVAAHEELSTTVAADDSEFQALISTTRMDAEALADKGDSARASAKFQELAELVALSQPGSSRETSAKQLQLRWLTKRRDEAKHKFASCEAAEDEAKKALQGADAERVLVEADLVMEQVATLLTEARSLGRQIGKVELPLGLSKAYREAKGNNTGGPRPVNDYMIGLRVQEEARAKRESRATS